MGQEDFLKDLTPSDSQFGEGTTEEVVTPDEPTEEEKSNRRERRLQAKLTAERESSIALAARLDALTEAQKFRNDTAPTEYEKLAEQIYGNDTPEKLAATRLLTDALKGVHTKATEDALAKFREEQAEASRAVAKKEQTLEAMVEELEDEYNVTIDKNTQKGFFALLEKLSPKDKDGNVKDYADHHAVWEEYQARTKKVDTRAKDLASRSMTRTGGGNTENIQVSAHERWLKENGII